MAGNFIKNLFQKKTEEPLYDPLNIKVTDIQKGFLVEFDFKPWIVTAVYEYDFGDNFFTKEFKLECENETMFLHVEKDDDLYLTLTQKVKVRAINEDIPEIIKETEAPPKKLIYNGVTYFRENETPGYFHDTDDDNDTWVEFIGWDYYDESEKLYFCIEQWGDDEFEAAVGKVIQEHQLSNILPGK